MPDRPAPRRDMAFDKHRYRFRKDGDLRFVSHLDLLRTFERILRRTGLPFRSTEGFHPQPRIVFAQSLSLGVSGLNEVVEIEWTEELDPRTILEQLNSQCPAGLSFLSARRIEMKRSARPSKAVYSLELPPEHVEATCRKCAKAMTSSEIWVPRLKPRPRELNVRPYLADLRVEGSRLVMEIWITQDGSARSDEVVKYLGLSEVMENGGVIERAELEIEDEGGPDSPPRPAMPGRDDRGLFERPLKDFNREQPARRKAATAHWGASPNGPIIE